MVKKNMVLKILLGVPVYLNSRHYEYKYGIHVDFNIKIGGGMKVVHGDGVYLNCSKVGKNFTVYQCVTLGADKNGDIPIVEDNVTVYTGAVVIGNVVLHSGCTVGANAVVTHDVAINEIVVGAPAHSIKKVV